MGVTLNEEKVQPWLHFTSDEEPTREIWYLDSDANNHMTRDWLKFREINQTFTGMVQFVDGLAVEI